MDVWLKEWVFRIFFVMSLSVRAIYYLIQVYQLVHRAPSLMRLFSAISAMLLFPKGCPAGGLGYVRAQEVGVYVIPSMEM